MLVVLRPFLMLIFPDLLQCFAGFYPISLLSDAGVNGNKPLMVAYSLSRHSHAGMKLYPLAYLWSVNQTHPIHRFILMAAKPAPVPAEPARQERGRALIMTARGRPLARWPHP